MTRKTLRVVDALRQAAGKLEQSAYYQWGHMGSCNCGFLAQQVTRLSRQEIHQHAMERYGDWSEQLNDYCPHSGLPIDNVISDLIAFGFDADELKHLERLSDPYVLHALPIEERNLRHNAKVDVVKYMRTWANLIEEKLVTPIRLTDLEKEEQPLTANEK